MDGLQTDLETLLSSAAKRMRLLEAQIQILTVWLEKGKVDKKSLPAAVATVAAATSGSTTAVASSSKTVRGVYDLGHGSTNKLICLMYCTMFFPGFPLPCCWPV